MANTIRDYSATPANNTVVDGADISEGCSPAGINDAIRGVMSDLKDVSTGAVALESPAADSLSVTGNVSAATFSGDGSSLTGIPTPTLTSLGIANHDDITVDGSGNVLVGTTNTDPAFNNVTGQSMASTGQLQVTRDGGIAALFNRKTSDGDIVQFRKNGGTVGSIGTLAGFLTVGTGDTGIIFQSNVDNIQPLNLNTNGDRDNAIDIGDATNRFKNLYLSGTVSADSLTIQSRNLTNNGYPVVEHSATAPSSPVDGQLWWNNSSDNLSIYKNSTAKWLSFGLKPDGSSAAQAITSTSQVVSSIGTNFTQGVYYINTPDGGVQQAYLMYAENHVWFLVGRFAASAASTVTNTLDSARSMIDVTQNGASKWSADFGSAFAEDVMIWGATDFPNQTGHTVNWVYQIGGATTLRSFFAGTTGDNSSTSNYTLPQRSGSHSSAKHSLYCENGARDGVFKGSRWTNNAMRYVLVSDAPSSCYTNPSGLSAPTSSMFYWDGAQDAKMSVTYSGDTVGQDYGNTSQMFGRDDSNTSFVDAGASTVNTNSPQGSYSSAVTIWARLH